MNLAKNFFCQSKCFFPAILQILKKNFCSGGDSPGYGLRLKMLSLKHKGSLVEIDTLLSPVIFFPLIHNFIRPMLKVYSVATVWMGLVTLGVVYILSLIML
jgi:hypothetical protein